MLADKFLGMGTFFGDHLQTNPQASFMRKSPDNHRLSWFGMYRDGMFTALLARNDAGERKLTAYVEPWLPFDESGYLVTREDNDYHKILAEFMQTGEVKSVELEAKIKSSRRSRPKHLVACLGALRQQDSKAFSASLRKFADYYLKSEFAQRAIDTFYSIEASILWHIAKRLGIDPTGLSERQLALIMCRESLGLAA